MIPVGAAVLATVVLAQSTWTVGGGAETFSLRDISRGKPPVDASPVRWEGTGPSLGVQYQRESERRFHRANGEVAVADDFAFIGPVLRSPAPASDHLTRIEGRYEYRRYPFTDLLVTGFDAGVGVQGLGRRASFTRHPPDSGEHARTDVTAAVACVVAARFHRWRRWSSEFAWTNGIGVVHAHDSQTVDALADSRRWGGGWLTDWSAAGAFRLAGRTSVSATYLQTGEGTMVSLHSYASSRRRLAVGVTYER
jgi:hypothetical protein